MTTGKLIYPHAILDVVIDNIVEFFVGETIILSKNVVESP